MTNVFLNVILFLNDSLCDLLSINIQVLEHFNNLITGHLNINSIRNKFEMMANITSNFSLFLISESNLDLSFPNPQFKINGYKIFRRDRNRYGGGLLLYVNEEIPSSQQTVSSSSVKLLLCNYLRLNVNGFYYESIYLQNRIILNF